MNVCVFIEYIVEVGNLPAELWFVSVGEYLEEVEPADLGLEADDVLDLFFVVGAEEHGRVVLVLHEELHGRLDQHGRSDHVGPMIVIQVVQEVTLVVLRHVNRLRGPEERVPRHRVLRLAQILTSLKIDSVGYLHLKQLKSRLIHRQIRHLDIQPVEVNAPHAFLHIARKFALADLVEPEVVGQCACLMKFSEQPVDFVVGVVKYELVPEAAVRNLGRLVLITRDNLLEVPWERQNVRVFLLRKLHIYTYLFVALVQLNRLLLLLLHFQLIHCGCGEETLVAAGFTLREHSLSGEKRQHAALSTHYCC